MPVYEYRCQACHCKFDRYFGSIQEAVDEFSCPECGDSDVRRLISAPAAHVADGGGSERVGEEGTPANTAVFGRKELDEALARRQDWISE